MARGDHIYVPRWRGLYTHHGIDLGDGTVVHFSGEPLQLRDACVVRDSMEQFCGGAEPLVKSYAIDTRSTEETVETALAHLGQTGYQLWANNCEHFASYCKIAKRESSQVRKAMRGLAVTGVTVAAASVLLVAVVLRRKGNQNGSEQRPGN